MKNIAIEIKQIVRNVKILHFMMMVVWPVLTIAMIVLDGYVSTELFVSYAYRSSMFRTLLIFLWLGYSYFMLTMMRNFNLQQIMSEYCEFGAYLECMTYLEKFYLFKSSKVAQRLNRTDAYLVDGNFDAAYENLNGLKQFYPKMSLRTQMLYDYFWCRFYGELEDQENFDICMNVFRKHWINEQPMSRKMARQAAVLIQELTLRQLLFQKNGIGVKTFLSKVYKSGRLTSRYEFIKYCYLMGKAEYELGNLMLAKHWFAQTVSFGLKEHMAKNAAAFLSQLEQMQVPYALTPPAENVYYGRRKRLKISSGLLSIFVSFLVMLWVIIR